MKGGEHKYGFNNNKREKPQKVKLVDDETGDKHELFEVLRMPSRCVFLKVFMLFLHHSTSSCHSFPESFKIMPSPLASPLPPPPPLSAPSDGSASPSAVKRARKASRLRSLSTRPLGAEIPVVYVDLATGKADGPHRKKLRTYLGIVARDKVDVTYENRKEVPTAQKDLIWEDIQASDSRKKRKLLQTVGERWRQFKSDLTRKWALAADQDGVEDTDVRKKAQVIQKQNTAPHVLSRGGYDYLEQKLLDEKTKKKLEEAAQSGSVDGVIDPPSPVRRHVKWKMVRMKKTGEMTTEAAKEITAKIDSFEDQATQGSFVPHGRQDVLAAAIGRPEHHVMASFSQMQSQIQSQMQSQGLALPPEPLVGPSDPRVSTKGSCVDPPGNDPETGDSDNCGLYIEADSAHLVAMGRVHEGSTVVHNTPLFPGQVKVSVEEVTDADAPVPVPTDEVSLVGQTLHTFFAWATHLVKSLSQQVAVSPTKPPPKPDPEVDDPLYLMTLTISELFLRPYQTSPKSHTVVNVSAFQCYSYGFWNSDIYGFLEPQSIQRSDNYLKGIINSALKGLDDAPQPKSKAPARWIVVKYFNDPRPLEPERLKALQIQWAQYYLRVRDQT
ncbi:hypothetical protein GmHk_02G004179 [Glycine max]|nr:hypothetical protein GmHk_02G004179 [Glycine max]